MGRRSTSKGDSRKVLEHIVSKARKNPFFVGWALSRYEAANLVDKAQLAGWLECTPEAMNRLAMCRLPWDDEEAFTQEVRRIAEFCSCNSDRLIQLFRAVAALNSFQKEGKGETKEYLLAARDRKNLEEDDSQDSKED